MTSIGLLSPERSAAQAPGVLPQTSQLPGSTRAMALGDAYAMDSGHADAVFYHPSLLTSASGMGIDIQQWGTSSSSAAVSAAFQWFGGGVGIGIRTLQHEADGRSAAAPGGQDHLFVFGTAPVSERVATVSYAHDFLFDMDLGVAMDFVDQRIDGVKQATMLFDVGISRDLGPVTMGLTASDIGDKPLSDEGSGPSRFLLGAGAYGQQLGIFDLGFAGKVGMDDDEFTYGGGVEIAYWPIRGRTFVARVGFQDVPDDSEASPLTTGFAYQGDDVTIEWAFRPFGDGARNGGSHRIGLRWR